jgi:SecD/SecF fusion protein
MQQAVNDGYRRSLNPVLDGHITVLMTAIILFIFGLGPVLGFATTQILGILLIFILWNISFSFNHGYENE